MTPKEAVAIVESKALGRTRYQGQAPFLDEVLVGHIYELRAELARLSDIVDHEDAEIIEMTLERW